MIIFILLPRKDAKYICPCAKLGYIPEIVRNKTIKHLKANILPTFDIYFMLSCTIKYFSEYSFGISYDEHAWHNIALLQFRK